MSTEIEKRRVLITAESPTCPALADLFHQGKVEGWKAEEARGFDQARFMLQHQPYDVLLVARGNFPGNDSDGLAWLGQQREVPVLFLARTEAGIMTPALDNGASQWLPFDLALENPPLLASALRQAAHITDLRRKNQRMGMSLQETRRQIDRLVNLLWRTLPGDVQSRWFTQRYMMERLHEEVDRSERYGDPLTVIIGEVNFAAEDEGDNHNSWVTSRVVRAKRRSDVAGQYGQHGFMLLLVHTPEAGGVVCCRRMQNILGQPATAADGFQGTARAYFGMASYSAELATPKRLLGLAEHQLEAAKQASESIGAAI